ncbi:MAG TPA: hypothetical protein VGO82_04420, partial [Enterovirga sp.]|nr:hypothetical protein [Enterovirga sp.]
MARAPLPILDPSRDAAALLRRLGFAVLMLVVPVAGLLSRRGVVLFVPIGVSLLVVAALLDGQIRPMRQTLARLLGSVGAVAIAAGLIWITVSLLWAPRPASSVERLLSVLTTLGIAFAGYLALPDRMRAANLYLVPVGAALATATAIFLNFIARDLDEDGGGFQRGLVVVALFAWPAIAWLRSREREIEALTLAILIATATVVVCGTTPVPIALGAGAVAIAAGLIWITLSLLWAPRPASSVERLLSVLTTLGIAFAGYLALPDRMRAANLYLVPVGAALAAATAIFLNFIARDLDEDGGGFQRGLVVVALFAWPAIAWLRSREREI